MKTIPEIPHLDEWQRTRTEVFWSEIAPYEHVVHIYEENDVFIDMLAGFADSGFNARESVIVIATKSHLDALDTKLEAHGVNVGLLVKNDQYIRVDSDYALASFMLNGWPDEMLFTKFVSGLTSRARNNSRNARAFVGIAAVLWSSGHKEAALQIEHLWSRFCEREPLTIFCAYPRCEFTQDADVSIQHICSKHSRIITSSDEPLPELLYKNVWRLQPIKNPWL